MALPSTGQISMSQVNTELGLASTTLISLNQSSVRTLAGISTGQIALSNLWGKSNNVSLTISTNQTNLNLRTYALANGWDGASALVVTIGTGVIVSSTAVGTPALTVAGSFPAGVSLINSGLILGKGGQGGAGGNVSTSGPYLQAGFTGSSGGLALSVSSAISITNNNIVAGGGGGGGGGGSVSNGAKSGLSISGGGGGGGGTGTGALGNGGSASGAAAGGVYQGRPGTAGTTSAGGAGGAAIGYGGAGGTGGAYGSSGSNGGASAATNFGQGGAGAAGAAGACTAGNSFITWTAVGNRYGALN
jgi:hypothetical protein